jgi:hypothetical protein
VEKVSDHGTIGPRKYFPKKEKKDNCKNSIDKRRNSGEKF